MAQPDDTNDSSAGTEPAARQPSVMPTAMELGAALRAKIKQAMKHAKTGRRMFGNAKEDEAAYIQEGRLSAFRDVLRWSDELKANAATIPHEVGDRSS